MWLNAKIRTMTDRDLPVGAYDIYIEGLLGIMKHWGLTLNEARVVALDDAGECSANEHLPLIEAAYQHLLAQQSTG